MKNTGLYLAVAVALIGCGGGSSKKPLTAAQKQQLSDVVNSAARTGTVSNNYAQRVNTANKGRNNNGVNLRALLTGDVNGFITGAPSSQTGMHLSLLKGDKSPSLNFPQDDDNSSDANQQLNPMEQQLDGNCEAEMPQAPTQDDGGLFPGFNTPQQSKQASTPAANEAKLRVYGVKCPIEFNLAVKSNMNQGKSSISGGVTMSVDYKVKDDAFRKLNDVDAFNLNAGVNVSASQSNIKVNATLDGSINSQQDGKVDMGATANLNVSMGKSNDQIVAKSAKLDVTMTVKAKDLDAELRVKASQSQGDTQPNVEITLNGEKMTEQDLEKLFGDASDLGQQASSEIGKNGSLNSRR